MGNATLWTRQPGFFVYTTYTVLKALIKLPCLMILYTIPSFRPLREWTHQTAFARALTRLFFEYASVVEFSLAHTLDPGKEKERFVAIAPFESGDDDDQNGDQQNTKPSSIYLGIAKPTTTTTTTTNSDTKIKPATVGGVWHPGPLLPESYTHTPGTRVFLHFHGGAYVLFDCRDQLMAFGARLLLQACTASSSSSSSSSKNAENAPPAAVLCARYRLASHGPGNRFPAALQDAITAYAHLVRRLGVPGRDVVVSGDSAGGNLALALLRYLSESQGHGLPLPGGVLLWSPWTDLTVDVEELEKRAEDRYDMVPPRLVKWAYRVFLPEQLDNTEQEGGSVRENPYISPVRRAIQTEVPIWVQVNGKEIIREDILRWVEVQKQAGTRVGVYEIPNAPHDTFMAGEGLGFFKESQAAADHAIRFLNGEE
ncbi:Alpha/Beta hydrolase protein [Achaetomium macrosporum]|uniref:Alpha/Beta hydrolase protein n=1 Tax=Achaetomium macrosporum TaxID=79813 RepID=A0AAN7CHR0_9PEZI|nr:Alpha/Beta hydrolase protein [Achaetomium macrosporum]